MNNVFLPINRGKFNSQNKVLTFVLIVITETNITLILIILELKINNKSNNKKICTHCIQILEDILSSPQ